MSSQTLDPAIKGAHHFYIGDYVVFGLTILVSISIGVFYAIAGRRKNNTAEYLVAGRSMGFLPLTISLIVSFESSIMMLGLPAEAYTYGLQFWWWILGVCISQLISVKVIVPLLHPLRITSAYEYLELRYRSRAVRLMGTVLGMLAYVWYMGVVLFGPAVALEAVSGYPLWNSIVVISVVSVLYTSIGGIKAVIWTDVFQAMVMLMGIFSILIKGTIDVGGPKKVWDIAARGGRMNFFNFDPDPRVRHTFWNLFVSSLVRGFGLGFNQSTIQRISSTKSLRDAKRMLYLTAPCFLVTLVIATYEGVVAYAYYETKQCDPLKSKQITNPNQIIPFIVLDIFQRLPGMPGLFLASLFSASLSTLSSGLSSLAALSWADIIQPLLGDVSEVKATIIVKFTVVCFGCLACGVAFLVSLIGGTLIQIGGSLISAFAGPLTGIFFLSCFFPRCNAKGCLVGGFGAMILCFWIAMGMNFSPHVPRTPTLPPASTDKCYLRPFNTSDSYGFGNISHPEVLLETTTTQTLYTSQQPHADGPQGIEVIYTLSYQLISVIGIFGTIIIGLFVSLLTGMNKPGDVDPRYLISVTDTILIFLPARARRYISGIGPQFMQDKYKSKFTDPSKKHHGTDMEVAVITEIPDTKNGHVENDLSSIPLQETASDTDQVQTSNGVNGNTNNNSSVFKL